MLHVKRIRSFTRRCVWHLFHVKRSSESAARADQASWGVTNRTNSLYDRFPFRQVQRCEAAAFVPLGKHGIVAGPAATCPPGRFTGPPRPPISMFHVKHAAYD